MYPPLARVKTPLAPWLTLSWSFLNVLTFVWPVPPLLTATDLFTSPLEVSPALILPSVSSPGILDTLVLKLAPTVAPSE